MTGYKISSIILSLFITILRAFVLKVIWGWYLVPYGVKALSFCASVGIIIIASLITYRVTLKDMEYYCDDDLELFIKLDIVKIISPVFTLLFAWFLLKFVM